LGKTIKKALGGGDDSAKKAAEAAERARKAEEQRALNEAQNKANVEAASTLEASKKVTEGATDITTSLADDTFLARKRKSSQGASENLGII
jgi:hypothetical protein